MNKRSILFIFGLHYVLLSFSFCFAQDEANKIERIAINALKEENAWTTNCILNAELVTNDYIKKHKILKIEVIGVYPPSIFYVAVGENEKTYVFSRYIYGGTKKFSELFNAEYLEVKKDNVWHYVKAFLLLVEKNSLLIEHYDDIYFADNYDKKMFSIYRNSVKPIEFHIENDVRKIKFFSLGFGKIFKWELTIEKNGEILSSKKNGYP